LVFYDTLEDGSKRVAGVHYGKPMVTGLISEVQKLKETIDTQAFMILELKQALCAEHPANAICR